MRPNTTNRSQDDLAETLHGRDCPASPAAASEQQVACACPANKAWLSTADDGHQQPTTANHHRRHPSHLFPHLPPSSSSSGTGVCWPPPQGPTKPVPSPPRSAGGLARCAMEGRLSAALIGCGGRLMRLGGCRLQQHRPPTDSLLLVWV
ncbi:hypothetical protein V501_07402 [Pseudogymnoascus sp. VKM F-4519 (FW-2642)]|nr:hypothetical protein V501_07402 [Pseudogymnoascus sp. VKM F-4519 (FW-2642)]